jgi:tetratricopeptide (TPR) repeat protein
MWCMRSLLFAFVISAAFLAISAASWAQQGDAGSAPAKSAQQRNSSNSSAASSNTSNQSQSNSSQPNASAAKPPQSDQTPDLADQPPVDSLSRDTTFPGDRPQNASQDAAKSTPTAPDLSPPRSDRVSAGDLGKATGESSSKSTEVDLNPPADDAKTHPQSTAALANAEAESVGGVSEFRVWDPHKAAKDVEVGDFYFHRGNYRAAEDRYREALQYKDNDADATIRLAVCLEKLGLSDDARSEYESYLRILPHGPKAGEAQRAIKRLGENASK